MATWHRLGDEAELRERVPFAVKLERHRIAVFYHDGAFRAISDIAIIEADRYPKARSAANSSCVRGTRGNTAW